jgi:hypothetical protein
VHSRERAIFHELRTINATSLKIWLILTSSPDRTFSVWQLSIDCRIGTDTVRSALTDLSKRGWIDVQFGVDGAFTFSQVDGTPPASKWSELVAGKTVDRWMANLVDYDASIEQATVKRRAKFMVSNRWKMLRKKKAQETPVECESCGLPRSAPMPIDCHHVIPNKWDGVGLRYLMWLCSHCHGVAHGLIRSGGIDVSLPDVEEVHNRTVESVRANHRSVERRSWEIVEVEGGGQIGLDDDGNCIDGTVLVRLPVQPPALRLLRTGQGCN